jgi:DNA-binding CsgD family transcriptional regulator
VSSNEIADRLFLSVHTVENHLQHAYTKLSVTGREQLEVWKLIVEGILAGMQQARAATDSAAA